jgi:hypothetical protein
MQKRFRGTRREFVELERPRFAQTARQFVPIKSVELEDCLTQQRRFGGRLGDILCEHGLLQREQVFQVLAKQAEWLANSLRADLETATLPYPASLSLCLPAYNEEENIDDTVRSACAILPHLVQDFEVVVVDDGSRDKTSEVVCRLAEKDLRVRLEQHEHNGGYGAAVTTGLRAARGDLVMFTDSDGQFNMLDLAQVLARVESHDMVVGYRHPRADRWFRKFNAWSWNQLIQLTLGISVTDLDCAFKLFRREVVDRLNLTSTGACISAEIMVQCVRGGVHYVEVPVRHFPRYHGDSTGANLRVILRAFRELPTLWHYRRNTKLLLTKESPRVAAASSTTAESLVEHSHNET